MVATDAPASAARDADTTTGVLDRPVPPRGVDGLTASDRRRLRRAWWIGAAPVVLAFTWVLTGGTGALFQRHYFDDFFDTQARALLDGRLDVPDGSLAFEGFVVEGRTYLYFGPVPSILRLPVLLVTDRFDGRLTGVSMLVAMVVLAIGAFRLSCAVRAMVRGEAPVGRRESVATAGLAVAALASPVFFLASQLAVYHEAELWGVTLTVWALDAVARWQREPTGRRLAVASLIIVLALLSRQTVGLGALAALALAGALVLRQRWRTAEPHRRLRAAGRLVGAMALAGLVPLGLSGALNYAKFGQVIGLPMDLHLQSQTYAERRAVIEANPSFVGPEYIATTAMQYFSVTALDLRADVPYLDFPRYKPKLHGDAVFDKLDWTSSLPVSAPALAALGLGGLGWAVATARRRRGDPARALSPLLVGSWLGGAVVLLWAYVANRYLGDLLPFALVAGAVGFHAAGRASAGWRPWARRTAMAGVVGLAAFGATVNLALALEYKYERGPVVYQDLRADWVRWRLALPGAPEPVRVDRGTPLPPVADGALVVVGDCDGLYVGVDDRWWGVERGPGVAVHELAVDLARLPTGGRVPLATFGTGDESTVVAATRLADGAVRVDVLQPAFFELDWAEGTPVDLDGTARLRIDTDPHQGSHGVYHGRSHINGNGILADGPVTLGRAPARDGVATRYPGPVTAVDPDVSICRDAID